MPRARRPSLPALIASQRAACYRAVPCAFARPPLTSGCTLAVAARGDAQD
jgi:hypothetical protein